MSYRERVAAEKRASFRAQTYWGRPVPNFLPPRPESARLLIVGLAPAAHGANRNGRMITCDRSGDFLFRGLYDAGFASQPGSLHAVDGLELRDAVIAAAAHCAPPDNKPTPDELRACSGYLAATFDALPRLRVVLALGATGHAAVVAHARQRGWLTTRAAPRVGHGARHAMHAGPTLLDCYHPSQQNTFTRRLTPQMLLDVLRHARDLLAAPTPRSQNQNT